MCFRSPTAPANAQIVHSGAACNVNDDNISERIYTIKEGDTLVLQCIVKGHPRPQVSSQSDPLLFFGVESSLTPPAVVEVVLHSPQTRVIPDGWLSLYIWHVHVFKLSVRARPNRIHALVENGIFRKVWVAYVLPPLFKENGISSFKLCWIVKILGCTCLHFPDTNIAKPWDISRRYNAPTPPWICKSLSLMCCPCFRTSASGRNQEWGEPGTVIVRKKNILNGSHY